MENTFATPELSAAEFGAIRDIVYRAVGINLHEGKEGLVRSRLARRLRAAGLNDYTSYLRMLEQDASGRELVGLIDSISTNKTSFFREPAHFDLLREILAARGAEETRIWSAGCSSGEEPCTMGMVALDAGARVRILATDISTTVLAAARAAVYDKAALQDVPRGYARYFEAAPGAAERVRVSANVRGLISFARLNLMETWPMRRGFHVIFCRNVMIYFDKATQARLVARFYDALLPGGYLMVGHSESLNQAGRQFHYVQPAVYRRER
jgi:chemotaxis protein methyltransferase CheR